MPLARQTARRLRQVRQTARTDGKRTVCIGYTLVLFGRLYAERTLRAPFYKQTIAAIAGKFLKNGYITFEEVEKDRRCKRIRFTQKGLQYAGEVIPAAARAENIAMAKLNVTTAAELVRLTEIFTKNMEIAFAETEEQK